MQEGTFAIRLPASFRSFTDFFCDLQAYISFTEADDDDENAVADYIIVVVNKVVNDDMLKTAKEAHNDADHHNAQ